MRLHITWITPGIISCQKNVNTEKDVTPVEVQNHKSAVIPSMKNRVEAQINYELENGNYIKAEEKSPEL